MKPGFLAGAISLLAVVTAACNSGTSTTGPRPTGPQGWVVSAGSSASNEALQALAFYPSSITVDAGDTVTWTSPTAEVHSVTFPIPGETPVPVTDPSASLPAGGTTFDGTAAVSSGFIAGGAQVLAHLPEAGNVFVP